MFLDEISRSASEPMSCLAVLGLITVHQEGHVSLGLKMYPPETERMSPEKGPFQKENGHPTINFRGDSLGFSGESFQLNIGDMPLL